MLAPFWQGRAVIMVRCNHVCLASLTSLIILVGPFTNHVCLASLTSLIILVAPFTNHAGIFAIPL